MQVQLHSYIFLQQQWHGFTTTPNGSVKKYNILQEELKIYYNYFQSVA